MKKYEIYISERLYVVEIKEINENKALVEVDGASYEVTFQGVLEERTIKRPLAPPPELKEIRSPSQSPGVKKEKAPPKPVVEESQGRFNIFSPLPGLVVNIHVRAEQRVQRGATLLIIEAMKMEIPIKAPREGIIEEIKVAKGDSIMEGNLLLVIGSEG